MFRENPSGCMLTCLFPAAPLPPLGWSWFERVSFAPHKADTEQDSGPAKAAPGTWARGQTRLPHGAPGRPGRSLPAAAWQEGAPGRLRKQSEKPTLLEKPSAVLGRV